MSTAINEMLSYALDAGASDLHLSVGSIPMVRIHGEMKKLQLPILDLDSMIAIKDKILNENQKKAFDEKLEIDFSTALEGRGRFRVNFLRSSFILLYLHRLILISNHVELSSPLVMYHLAVEFLASAGAC